MNEKIRTKLAKFAKAAFRSQMELNDWLLDQAQERGLLNQKEIQNVQNSNYWEKDEKKILENIVAMLAEDARARRFGKMFYEA